MFTLKLCGRKKQKDAANQNRQNKRLFYGRKCFVLIFDVEEFKGRVKRVQESMQEKSIEVLLVSDPSNIYYLSGYDAWSFYVPQGLVVTLTDEMPVFIGRHMDAFAGVVKTTWLDEQHVRWYADTTIHSTTSHPMQRFAEVLGEFSHAGTVIGLEMDSNWFTATCYEHLKAGLPDVKFADANTLVNWVRIIKSENEIALQRVAGKIAELGILAARDTLGPGVRECDVAAAIYAAQLHGTEEFGGDYASIVPMLPSGEKAGAPHLTWTDRRYPENICLYIELAGSYYKYHSPLARTFSIGKPNKDVDYVSKSLVEGLNSALDTVKPGVTAEEVELAFRNTMKKHGLEKNSRIGYSVGIGFPPDWGERTISLRPGDKTVLQPNMTLHCVPGMYYDNFGVSISEAFRVTETGIETFANLPKDLIVID